VSRVNITDEFKYRLIASVRVWSHNSLFYIFSSSPCLSFIGNQTYLCWLQSKPSVISFYNFNHSIRPPVVRSHALIRLVKPEAPSTTPVNPHLFHLFCLPRTLCQARSARVGAPNRIRNPTVFACRTGLMADRLLQLKSLHKADKIG
jgi:hypothetical protein